MLGLGVSGCLLEESRVLRAQGRAPPMRVSRRLAKGVRLDSEDTYSVIALSPGKIL